MSERVDRRSFLKIAGTSLGIGALYSVAPLLGADGEAGEIARTLWKKNGEKLKPFSFVQLSDTHVGFNGPPDPLGTQAFERAVEMINGLRHRPDLVLVSGDLTHDSEKPGEHADRMRRFKEISGRLKVDAVHCIPGETPGSTAGPCSATRSARPFTLSTTAECISSGSTMCRVRSRRSAPSRSPG